MASNTSLQQPPASAPSQQQQQEQADFHAASNTQLDQLNYTTSENQLAGLVQAATAAAGQADSDWATAAAAAAAAGHHQLGNFSAELHLPDDGFDENAFGQIGSPTGTGRQNRGSAAPHGQLNRGLSRTVSKKRKRGDEALDPALTGLANQTEQHLQAQQQQQEQQEREQQAHQSFEGSDFGELTRSQSQSQLADARAAGVHSAAALFRQPSSNKKYTRPPMSRLYASLELSPENFLHLQAAAKNYMLDDAHPERRDCVGQRGKGDSEMVKLRLWNCVRDFLESEGNGERYFGEHVVNEGMPPRQYIWPRDQHKIISLVIPLLRRMVTNERQRQYAIETRKGGTGSQSEDGKRRKTDDRAQPAAATEQSPGPRSQSQAEQTQNENAQAEYSQIPNHFVPPPPPLPHQGFPPEPQQTGIGLSPLVLEGYPTDWDTISQQYNAYNQNYQLDTLWGVSGLQQPDWWGLVAAIDSHWKVVHNGNPTQCAPQCEDHHLNAILSSNELPQLDWRIGASANDSARMQFASSVTRDLDRIIKESLVERQQNAGREAEQVHVNDHAPFLFAGYGSHSTAPTHTSHPHDTSPITLHLNVLHEGKRIFPRLDLTAEQCPDLQSVMSAIAHRWVGQFPAATCDANGNVNTQNWKVQVWLPEGLMPAENDGDWTIAQLTAGTVDWMDNGLRVVIDLGI